MSQDNGLQQLVKKLREINLNLNEAKVLNQVKPLVQQCIAKPDDWFEDRFYLVDEEQGFGSHLIAENDDHTLAVIITSWPPKKETPPHNHDTWAVIGCIKGAEKNTFWQRNDNGSNPDYADISRATCVTCTPGEVITMKQHDIHSVVNPNDNGVSVSLHIYGKHFNHTNRHQFDPESKTLKPFIVRQN